MKKYLIIVVSILAFLMYVALASMLLIDYGLWYVTLLMVSVAIGLGIYLVDKGIL